mmetsp:Transcript_58015/g.151230  ORF Transcript_58015/g.151230 Transcript_58015/m.151230 type:complete len:250 (-) Transcript_58015:916-1665(-)
MSTSDHATMRQPTSSASLPLSCKVCQSHSGAHARFIATQERKPTTKFNDERALQLQRGLSSCPRGTVRSQLMSVGLLEICGPLPMLLLFFCGGVCSAAELCHQFFQLYERMGRRQEPLPAGRLRQLVRMNCGQRLLLPSFVAPIMHAHLDAACQQRSMCGGRRCALHERCQLRVRHALGELWRFDDACAAGLAARGAPEALPTTLLRSSSAARCHLLWCGLYCRRRLLGHGAFGRGWPPSTGLSLPSSL